MRYNINIVVSLIALIYGIYGAITKDFYAFFYGMLSAIFLVNLETMRVTKEKFKK